ncbi:hypothetical protein [Planosporangium flavigriseum]|nr:hypothetical protein [Planosporangium flavigriseum]
MATMPDAFERDGLELGDLVTVHLAVGIRPAVSALRGTSRW